MHLLEFESTRFASLRRQLIEHFPDIDDTTLHDTLEGASNLKEAVAAVVRSSSEDEALIAGLRAYIEDLRTRLERLGHRVAKKRALALQALEEAGIEKIIQPDFTVSIRNVSPAVRVTDAAAIPEQFLVPQPPKINKRLLADTLKTGRVVVGAELTNARRTLSVRVK